MVWTKKTKLTLADASEALTLQLDDTYGFLNLKSDPELCLALEDDETITICRKSQVEEWRRAFSINLDNNPKHGCPGSTIYSLHHKNKRVLGCDTRGQVLMVDAGSEE